MATSTVDGKWYGNLADYVGTDMNPKKTTKGNDTLDKNAFLNILIAQLKNQDPLSPMDNSEMVNQLTQFTTIEQLQQQTAATTLNQAYSMIGKYATAQLRNPQGVLTNAYVYGRVESVFKQNGDTWLTVGGENVKLDDIHEVYDLTSVAGDSGTISTAAAVIGKYVVAKQPQTDEEGNPIEDETVKGFVDSVVIEDGIVFVKIGDKKVSFSQITQILQEEPPEPPPAEPKPPEETPGGDTDPIDPNPDTDPVDTGDTGSEN